MRLSPLILTLFALLPLPGRSGISVPSGLQTGHTKVSLPSPDLHVPAIRLTRTPKAATKIGTPGPIQISVRNSGSKTADAFEVSVECRLRNSPERTCPAGLEGHLRIARLAAGQTTRVRWPKRSNADWVAGDYTLTVTVDSRRHVSESNERNNLERFRFTVRADGNAATPGIADITPAQDLRIDSLRFSTVPAEGDKLGQTRSKRLQIRVRNASKARSPKSSVGITCRPKFEMNHCPRGIDGVTPVPALKAGESRTIYWPTPKSSRWGKGTYTVFAMVDPDKKIRESNENNNFKRYTFTVKEKKPKIPSTTIPVTTTKIPSPTETGTFLPSTPAKHFTVAEMRPDRLPRGTTTTVHIDGRDFPAGLKIGTDRGIRIVGLPRTTSRRITFRVRVDDHSPLGRHRFLLIPPGKQAPKRLDYRVVDAQTPAQNPQKKPKLLPTASLFSLWPDRVPRGERVTLKIRAEGLTSSTVFRSDVPELQVLSYRTLNSKEAEVTVKTAEHSRIETGALLMETKGAVTPQGNALTVWVVDAPHPFVPKLDCEKYPEEPEKPVHLMLEPPSVRPPLWQSEVHVGETGEKSYGTKTYGAIPYLDDQTELKWTPDYNRQPDVSEFIVRFFTPELKEVYAVHVNGRNGSLTLSPAQLYEIYQKLPATWTVNADDPEPKKELAQYVGTYKDDRFLFWQVVAKSKKRNCDTFETYTVAESNVSVYTALRMGAAPTGTTCDSRNTVLTASKTGGSESKAFYPGDTIELYGEFSLEHSPWRPTHLVIDWGDGHADVRPLGFYDRDSAAQCKENDPNFPDFSCELQSGGNVQMIKFSHVKHVYHEAGRYKVRVYVLPESELGRVGEIASFNRRNDARELADAHDGWADIRYASAGRIKSDRPEPFKSGAGVVRAKTEKIQTVTDRIFEVYCNPLDILVVKDPAAAGPLTLTALEISGFSTDDAVHTFNTATDFSVPSGFHASYSTMPVDTGLPEEKRAKKISTVISACDALLLAEAQLRYHGQGFVRLTWKVDGVTVETRELAVGPSTGRQNLDYGNPSSWPPPIDDILRFSSPQLPIRDLGEHRFEVSAAVIADPTASKTDAGALKPEMIASQMGGAGRGSLQARPVLPEKGIDLRSPVDPESPLITDGISATNSRALKARPYYVEADGQYRVTAKRGDAPCLFRFPLEDGGVLTVFDLRDLKKGPAGYRGRGKVLFRLANSDQSVGSYYLPVRFEKWQADGVDVKSGELHAEGDAVIDDLPGMKAVVHTIDATAGGPATAKMDIAVSDTSLYTASSGGKAEPHRWEGLSGPLSSQGDWYVSEQTLPLTRIGWSLFNIDASRVSIDLSHREGRALCHSTGGNAWIGIDLGDEARLYPYTFHLANDISFPVEGWSITGNGLCGTAASEKDFSHVFGDGRMGWTQLDVQAGGHDFNARYKGFYVDMVWPKVRLEGGNISLQYRSTENPDAEVAVAFDLNQRLHETYGPVTLDVEKIKSFEQRGHDWGIATRSKLSFFDRENKNRIDVGVDDLFFSVFSTLGFGEEAAAETTIALKGQTINLGGANVDVTDVHFTANRTHGKSRRLDAVFTAKLTLDAWSETSTRLHYTLDRPAKTVVAAGPRIEAFRPVKRNSPDVKPVNQANLKDLKYKTGGSTQTATTAASPRYASLLFDPSLPYGSDAGLGDYPHLAGLSVNASAAECNAMKEDTFSAHVDTRYFGSDGPAIAATFRYGTVSDKSYWLFFSEWQGPPNIPIFAGVFLYKLRGGAVYRFDPMGLVKGNGCNLRPDPKYGPGLGFGAGVTIADENMLSVESTMIINPTDGRYGFYGIKGKLLKTVEITQGKMEYVYGSHFQAVIGAKVDLPKQTKELKLDATNGKDGKIDLHLGNGNYYLHIGTREKNNRINGTLLDLLTGDMYLMAGTDIKGIEGGIGINYTLSSRDNGEPCCKTCADCASLTCRMDTFFKMMYDPFSLYARNDVGLDAKGCLDFGKLGTGCASAHASGYLELGCCKPTLLAAGLLLDFPSPFPNADVGVKILPDPDLDVDIHW